MKDNNQVSQIITTRLIREMQEGCFREARTLPPEVQLAEQMQVSRNVIREALARLEREGWVARKHGVGTMINRHVIDAGARLDLNYEFKRTLEMSGHEVTIGNRGGERIPVSEKLADTLGLSPGEEVFRASRVFYGNGKPVIYCEDYLPVRYLPEGDISAEQFDESFFSYMEKYCGIRVESSLAEIRARQVSPEAAQALELPEDTVLLAMEEVSYDLRARSVLYSESVFVDQAIHHTIVRKKI